MRRFRRKSWFLLVIFVEFCEVGCIGCVGLYILVFVVFLVLGLGIVYREEWGLWVEG